MFRIILFASFLFGSSMVLGQCMQLNCTQGCSDAYIGCTEISFSKDPGGAGVATYVWTSKIAYDFSWDSKVIIEFDAAISGRQEIMLAFSNNRRPWGDPYTDAVTIGYITKWNKVAIRKGMFADWIGSVDNYYLTQGQWHHFKLELTQTDVTIYIDSNPSIYTSGLYGNLPTTGYIGFIGYDNVNDRTLGTAKYTNCRITNEHKVTH